METTPYTTLQDILEEAGLAVDVHGEAPAGAIDGTNKVFTVQNKPLTDSNYDDVVNKDDLKLYYDGVPQTISSVDVAFGIITAQTAPDEGVEVTVDYRYSAVSMEFVTKRREEAEEMINDSMKKVDSCAPYGVDSAEVPKTIRNITRQFVAAWLHIRDYGFNQDTEGTSKDGYKRLEETAEKALEKYAALGGKCGSDGNGTVNGGIGSVATASDGDLFPQPDFEDRTPPEKEW